MVSLRQEARVIERVRIVEMAVAESVTEAARRFQCPRTYAACLRTHYVDPGT